MTSPRWTRNAYVKLILAILVIVCIIVSFVWLSNSYSLLGTSSLSSQSSEKEELSKTSNLKSLVESFLKGESQNYFFFIFCIQTSMQTHTHSLSIWLLWIFFLFIVKKKLMSYLLFIMNTMYLKKSREVICIRN